FGVIGASVGVLDCRAAEFRERDDDQVVPARFVAVFHEVFAERVNCPGDAALQVRVRAGQSALGAVSVESAHFGAGNDGLGFVEDQRRRLQVVEETVGARIDYVLLGVVGVESVAAVLRVGGRKQVIGSVVVGVGIINKGVA